MKPTPTTCMATSVGDSEKAAGHRDQKKRTAGNSGSTSRTCSSQDAEDQSGREVYADTECMCSCQSHDGNGDRCTTHVDGRTKRDGDGVGILIKSEILAQLPVFTGMLAAELLVKKAVIPLSFRQRRTSGYGFWRVQI